MAAAFKAEHGKRYAFKIKYVFIENDRGTPRVAEVDGQSSFTASFVSNALRCARGPTVGALFHACPDVAGHDIYHSDEKKGVWLVVEDGLMTRSSETFDHPEFASFKFATTIPATTKGKFRQEQFAALFGDVGFNATKTPTLCMEPKLAAIDGNPIFKTRCIPIWNMMYYTDNSFAKSLSNSTVKSKVPEETRTALEREWDIQNLGKTKKSGKRKAESDEEVEDM